VHAPNCLVRFRISDYAPQGWRAVADTGRWATISLRAAITMIVTFASATHAQVVASYSLSPNYVDIGGVKRYNLGGSEKKKLVAEATRTVSPGSPLYNVSSYYGFRNVPIGYLEVPNGEGEAPPDYTRVPVVELLFGPYNSSETSFSMDGVLCTKSKSRKWSCESKETWTYIHPDGPNSLVSFGSGISMETARMIASYEGTSCPLPKVEMKNGADRKAILSAPHIYLDRKAGNYVRSGERCFLKIWVKDGQVDKEEPWATIS
jgi:hypothetical protein